MRLLLKNKVLDMDMHLNTQVYGLSESGVIVTNAVLKENPTTFTYKGEVLSVLIQLFNLLFLFKIV